MKQHEREYFVSRIRTGFYIINEDNIQLKIVMPSIIDEFELNAIYNEAYDKALNDDFMTEQQMNEWMIERKLWTQDDEEKINGLRKDIEKLKVEIFNSRNNESLKEKIRIYIRTGEKQLSKQLSKKNEYQSNTCEGIASNERLNAFLKRCTYLDNLLYDFKSLTSDYVLFLLYKLILNESQIREIARTEPWRGYWVNKDIKENKLFFNDNTEFSPDQKHLLIWSRMYDNIQESLDYPSEDVVEDDDMLDGWLIIQKQKRDKERAVSELENTTKNNKIKNSSEILVMAGSNKDIQRINNMNDVGGKIIKQQRFNTIYEKGEASQLDFQDEKLKMVQQSNQMFKDQMRR